MVLVFGLHATTTRTGRQMRVSAHCSQELRGRPGNGDCVIDTTPRAHTDKHSEPVSMTIRGARGKGAEGDP